MIYDKASGRHTVREKFSKLLNTHKYKSHNRLEEDEKVYLKISLQSCHPRPVEIVIFKFPRFLGYKP